MSGGVGEDRVVAVVERARADLVRGEPWRARDRLLGALRDRPLDQEVLRALAETYVEMRDLPAAGACWFLTSVEDDDPVAAAALGALRDRYRRGVAVALAVRVRGRAGDYPEAARRRILDLQAELVEAGWTWLPPGRPLPPRSRRRAGAEAVGSASAAVGVIAFVLVNLAVYVLGLIAILRWIW